MCARIPVLKLFSAPGMPAPEVLREGGDLFNER